MIATTQSPKKELVCSDAPKKNDNVTMTTQQSWKSFSSHVQKDHEINALLEIIQKLPDEKKTHNRFT